MRRSKDTRQQEIQENAILGDSVNMLPYLKPVKRGQESWMISMIVMDEEWGTLFSRKEQHSCTQQHKDRTQRAWV